MVLGIDASNIKAGGGFTHLKELLTYAEPQKYGFSKVIIYGGKQLDELPRKDWIVLSRLSGKDSVSNFSEMIWRKFKLPKLAKEQCDLLFCPGGIFYDRNVKYVSMSQNMLIWQKEEKAKFNKKDQLRLALMTFLQKRSFRFSKGIVFISQFASDYIRNSYKKIASKPSTIVPHGISDRFRKAPESNLDFKNKKISLLYISTIHHYKYQWNVIEAVSELRQERGFDIHLDLIGAAMPEVYNKMKHLVEDNDFVKYHGVQPYEKISEYYHQADAFVFASSCENMPNILIEAMSAGIPIASSDYGPMPEILKDAGEYFDPQIISSIKVAIEKLIDNPSLAETYSIKGYEYAEKYTWERTSHMTFEFLKQCAQ